MHYPPEHYCRPSCPLRGTWQRDFTSLVPWIIWILEPCGVWVNFFHFSLSFSPDSTHLRYIFQLLVSCLFLNMIKCTSPSLQSPQIPIQFSIQAEAWTTMKPLKTRRIHSVPCRGRPLGSSVQILTDPHCNSVTDLAEWCEPRGSDHGCWVSSPLCGSIMSKTTSYPVWSHENINVWLDVCFHIMAKAGSAPGWVDSSSQSLIWALVWFEREREISKLEMSPFMCFVCTGDCVAVFAMCTEPNHNSTHSTKMKTNLCWTCSDKICPGLHYITPPSPARKKSTQQKNGATTRSHTGWSLDDFKDGHVSQTVKSDWIRDSSHTVPATQHVCWTVSWWSVPVLDDCC